MANRRKSREFALQVLYQLEITKEEVSEILTRCGERLSSGNGKNGFAERIVFGILEHCQEIDFLIERYSDHWRLDRMNIIDRNILRMAVYELLYCEDIPPKVTLNEAIDLGKHYGDADSGSFINGILDRIQKEVVRKPSSQSLLPAKI